MGNISYSCSVFAVNYRVICFCCVILALSLEGSAVGALGHGGVGLVGYHLDLGKRAVVLLAAMVGALGNGAADALVCVHLSHLTFCDIDFIICRKSVVILICKNTLKERIFP